MLDQPQDPRESPPCLCCKHLIHIGDLDLTGWTCKAYPEGIPRAILMRAWHHTQPGWKEKFVYEPKVFPGEGGKKYTVTFGGDIEYL